MSTQFELVAELREQLGKGAMRRLRKENKVPGVIYGAGEKSVSIVLDHQMLLRNLENEAFYSHVLTINMGSKKEQAVLKDLQRHPWKPSILHLDLQRISDTQKIRMQVPLHFVGADKSPAVKLSKAIVNHLMTNVEVLCLAKHLPEFVEVDLSALKEGESVHLSDIKLPDGVEITALLHAGHDQAIAAVHVPRGVADEEAATGTDQAASDSGAAKT